MRMYLFNAMLLYVFGAHHFCVIFQILHLFSPSMFFHTLYMVSMACSPNPLKSGQRDWINDPEHERRPHRHYECQSYTSIIVSFSFSNNRWYDVPSALLSLLVAMDLCIRRSISTPNDKHKGTFVNMIVVMLDCSMTPMTNAESTLPRKNVFRCLCCRWVS